MASPLLIPIRDMTSKNDMNIAYNRALLRMRGRWHARHRVNLRRMDVASRASSAMPIVKASTCYELLWYLSMYVFMCLGVLSGCV